MSNDRHEDQRVSATYKELAVERTPEHLDRKVLVMAAGAAKKPIYARWMSWSRPVAWAATITLCLAITLELALDPSVQSDIGVQSEIHVQSEIDLTSLADTPAPRELKRESASSVDDLRQDQDSNERATDLYKDKDATQTESSKQWTAAEAELQQEAAASIAETATREKTSLARSASKQVANEPAAIVPETELRDAALLQDTALSQDTAPIVQAAPAPERARMEDSMAVSAGALSDFAEADDQACPAEVRAAATDWLECILELEDQGDTAAADAERAQLIDTFPDFKLP